MAFQVIVVVMAVNLGSLARGPLTARSGGLIMAGKQSEPANRDLATPVTSGLRADELEDDFSTENPSGFAPGSTEELEDMRAKVALYQAEIEANRRSAEAEDALMEEEGSFLGDSIGGFVVNSLKSIPEYEVPNPPAMVRKMGITLTGLVLFFIVVVAIDGLLLEALRPIVKYQVDNAPSL